MKTPKVNLFLLILSTLFLGVANAEKLDVNITPDLGYVMVKHHDGKDVQSIKIMRNQDTKNTVSQYYALTSRKCPPFCVQPMHPFAPHAVDTIGEVELLNYVQKMKDNSSIVLIDSRTPDWIVTKSGTIPGAVNIPWTALNPAKGATSEDIIRIMEDEFDVIVGDGEPWSFATAKTLVLFCNGMWCGQSPTNIRTLLGFGYPASKIKWYRGGMQNWEALGFTTVKSARVVN